MNPPLDRTPHDPRRSQRPLADRAASNARAQAAARGRSDRPSFPTSSAAASARTERSAPPDRYDEYEQAYDEYDEYEDEDADHADRRGGRRAAPMLHIGPDPLRSSATRAGGAGHGGHGGHGGHAGHGSHRMDRRPLLVVGIAATLVCGVIALRNGAEGGSAGAIAPAEVPAATAAPAAADPAAAAQTPAVDPTAAASVDPATGATMVAGDAPATAAVATPADGVQDLDGDDLTSAETCLMDELSVRIGESGQSVTCLQQALTEQGFYTGPISGSFDQATFTAVEAMQTDRNLYVDGIVGRESAISLGIWPDEESFVTRTPPPPPGAVDLLGYPLSSVASAGADAPPLPENSGTGRRIVYDRAGQRVWAVGSEGEIIRSWLVSGSKYSNELPGTHEVYSKSEVSTAWNGKAYLPKMVRWLKTQKGAIGFHSIPLHVEDKSPYQTEAELGQRLSGGCQRQAVADANFLWDWADIGTKVVVV